MEIKIEELRKGDEVLVCSGGNFRYLKLLITPAINNKTGRYKSTLCLAKIKIIDKSWKRYDGTIQKWSVKKYICEPPEETDIKVYCDFKYKTIWLVKREEF